MFSFNTQRGAASSTAVAVITVIGGVVAAAVTALGTAGTYLSDVKSDVASVETAVSVLEEREDNHYGEVQKTLLRLEDKIDMIAEGTQ